MRSEVTVVRGMSVCVSVHISPTERLFVLKTLSRTQRATKVKTFVGICLKLLRSRVIPRNICEKSQYAIFSDLPAVSFLRLTYSEAPRGYPTIVNNIQPCLKQCLLLPLARVVEQAPHAFTANVRWPISAHAHGDSTQTPSK